MNERDPLEEVIFQFREMAPPLDVRIANRLAVRSALDGRFATHWWQRTVTISLPTVLATGAALILSLSIQLFNSHRNTEFSESNVRVPPAKEEGGSVTTLLATCTKLRNS
jgi:hypothetical protein